MIELYVGLVIALPLAIGAVMAMFMTPLGRSCMICGEETLRLRQPPLSWLSALLPRAELHRRWCPRCGWEGITRVVSSSGRLERGGAGAVRAEALLLDPTTDTIDLRVLDLGAQRWRVLLQCWREAGAWAGRLIYVGPNGRAWTDPSARLRGGSAADVLGQALVMPDGDLSRRIRLATSR